MAKWIEGLSTRAALISGFIVTVFAGLSLQQPESDETLHTCNVAAT